ncbi:MAG: translation initiation factor IF-3 [Candidatus Omnitrophica bacterium]|nr:translation initiation factor IF-3 [Candidatus Omnitrophota bacterium]
MVHIRRFIRINERINAAEVRLIDPDGKQLGVVPLQKALEIANQYDLDLIEVAPQASPPVCKIADFSKFKYNQEKKERLVKKHHKQGRLKEIRLKPNINEHDYQTKLKQAMNFLKKKDKVKINMFFRGRQMEHLELGKQILDKLIQDTQQIAQIEKEPHLEGRVMSLVFAPR